MTRLIDVCVPNARDHGRDGVPARIEDWNRCDMVTEMACRCGFPHAMQNTIAASWPSRNAIETEEFLDSPAWEWQHEDLLLPRIAPDLPAHATRVRQQGLPAAHSVQAPGCKQKTGEQRNELATASAQKWQTSKRKSGMLSTWKFAMDFASQYSSRRPATQPGLNHKKTSVFRVLRALSASSEFSEFWHKSIFRNSVANNQNSGCPLFYA